MDIYAILAYLLIRVSRGTFWRAWLGGLELSLDIGVVEDSAVS